MNYLRIDFAEAIGGFTVVGSGIMLTIGGGIVQFGRFQKRMASRVPILSDLEQISRLKREV
jgi:hypothetical protein